MRHQLAMSSGASQASIFCLQFAKFFSIQARSLETSFDLVYHHLLTAGNSAIRTKKFRKTDRVRRNVMAPTSVSIKRWQVQTRGPKFHSVRSRVDSLSDSAMKLLSRSKEKVLIDSCGKACGVIDRLWHGAGQRGCLGALGGDVQ